MWVKPKNDKDLVYRYVGDGNVIYAEVWQSISRPSGKILYRARFKIDKDGKSWDYRGSYRGKDAKERCMKSVEELFK